MSKKKNKKNCDTKEFTAVKPTDCDNKSDNCNQDKQKQHSEKMRITDLTLRPNFEI